MILKKVFLYIIIVSLYSCGIYSFTGASIDPRAKTVSIQYLPNRSDLVQPMLSQMLTEAIRNRFMSQTNLSLVNRNGDLNIEGEITGYTTTPKSIQGNETAALNTLTITVNIRFTNKYDEKQNFETSFTRYKDYESSKALSSIENDLIKQINEELVDDIFNKSVANW